MKRIAFVDYYLGNWHADNYPAWIREAASELGVEITLYGAYAKREVSPVNGVTTDDWCKEKRVKRFDDLDALCREADAIVILAPSDPEEHLPLAREAFKHGKPTYIDKTFAPDLKTAQEIFALASEYSVPFFSTSALRYATELSGMQARERVDICGGGRTMEEYVIHQIEMLTLLSGGEPVFAEACVTEGKTTVTLGLSDGITASLTHSPELAFSVSTDGKEAVEITSSFFNGLIREMVRFLDTGVLPFDPNETLRAMRLRDAALLAASRPGEKITL